MRTLLLPCAGKSSRYPGVRPKWMLTAPSGRLAIEEAAASVEAAGIRRRIIAIRADHDRQFGAGEVVRHAFGTGIDIVLIDEDTNGPAETVGRMIEAADVAGAILIKDADSFFVPAPMPQSSFVAVTDLRVHLDLSRVGAKSFISLDERGLITGIAEKCVSSNFVSAGLYGIADARTFLQLLAEARGEAAGEIFVSHIVARALAQGETFRPHFVAKFIDVGTLKDWREHVSRHRVLLVDIDGIVFKNQSRYFSPYWGEPPTPIEANVAHLRALQQQGAQLVFVTSRPESLREATLAGLEAVGLAAHALVMACQHGARVLVNDYSPSNPYPSAVAVNLARNAPDLPDLLP